MRWCEDPLPLLALERLKLRNNFNLCLVDLIIPPVTPAALAALPTRLASMFFLVIILPRQLPTIR
jgi:hypothetical protein